MIEVGIGQLIGGYAQGLPAIKTQQLQAVNALIGTRFYPVVLPENPTWPCASYQLISDTPGYSLSGPSGLDVKRIQIDAWSGGPTNASFLVAKQIALAIRLLLAGSKSTPYFAGKLPDGSRVAAILVAGSHDSFEQDARAYRSSVDYMIHFYPA